MFFEGHFKIKLFKIMEELPILLHKIVRWCGS